MRAALVGSFSKPPVLTISPTTLSLQCVASRTLTVDLGGPFDGLFTDALDTLHKSGTLKLFLTNARHLLGDVVPSLTVLTINDCPGTWFDVTISPPPPEVASITKPSLLGNVINIQVLGSMDGSASIGV